MVELSNETKKDITKQLEAFLKKKTGEVYGYRVTVTATDFSVVVEPDEPSQEVAYEQ